MKFGEETKGQPCQNCGSDDLDSPHSIYCKGCNKIKADINIANGEVRYWQKRVKNGEDVLEMRRKNGLGK